MTKALPKDITSYDLLKTLAVVLMIIDHIGIYFYPEAMWWRAVGRMSAPIWLFLIGYAMTRDVPARLWGGALILTLTSLLVAPHIFPLTILVGMALVRPVLDRAAAYVFSGLESMLIALGVITLLLIPSHLPVEYGLFCLTIPLYGFLRRQPEKCRAVSRTAALGFIGFTAASYAFMNIIGYEFDTAQSVFVAAGTAIIFTALYGFKSATYPALTKSWPRPLTALIQFGGRRTLEIYVAHLLVFRLAAYLLGIEGFGLFEWSWY
ncbi:MAG: hypothetical protein KDJ35_09370 [Alphaproteobacteria bacterium]|nr:hypothetical protein [Alphaproteobacteria bacterium]